jgi:hypothetical protein
MADAADQLAHFIRDLIDEALAKTTGMRGLERPNLTEHELWEYLRFDLELPVTRRTIKYAVMRREIIPTRLGNGNYFSKHDGLEWVKSRKR